MKICRCNNCGKKYEDINPGTDSLDYPNQDLPILEAMEVEEDGETVYLVGCPVCRTDAYLMDNIE